MKSAGELKNNLRGLMEPPPSLSVSAWSDSYRMLPAESSEPGRYKTSRVPYMREVQDALTQGDVHKIAVKSSSQTGKSECLLNIIGRFAMLDPCNILLVQPTIDDAMEFSKMRLQKMISDTKILTPLFYTKLKSRDADQTILSKVFKGGRIILKGANSPSGLAGRPIRILLCDEVDRYPLSASQEGDPISLAIVRCSTYWNYKVALFSTPTIKGQSRIDAAYEEGTQEVWSHRCPNCQSLEVLDYRQMISDYKVREDSAGNKSVVVKSVKWRCPQCGYEFSEKQMRQAAQAYVVKNPDARKNGVRSFYINGFSSPWLKWTDIMREYYEAQGNPVRESVVFNTRFGLSYEMPSEVDEKSLGDKLEDYGGELPAGVLLLTAGVDCQKNRLEYGIYGFNGESCFAICADIIRGQPDNPSTWQALDGVLDRCFYFADGTPLKIARTFVDSGFATSFVYDYCRRRAHKGVFAIKGASIYGAPLLNKTTRLNDVGIFLTSLNVDDGKNEIYGRLTAGTVHFGRDVDSLRRNFDDVYFRQLTSEHRVKKPNGREVFEKISKDRRNEQLDILVYALAAQKSCISGDEKSFWLNQAANLRGEPTPSQTKKTSTVKSRRIELWR